MAMVRRLRNARWVVATKVRLMERQGESESRERKEHEHLFPPKDQALLDRWDPLLLFDTLFDTRNLHEKRSQQHSASFESSDYMRLLHAASFSGLNCICSFFNAE